MGDLGASSNEEPGVFSVEEGGLKESMNTPSLMYERQWDLMCGR